MTKAFRDWLPESALFPTDLAADIDAILRDWCLAWIGRPCLSRGPFERAPFASGERTSGVSQASPIRLSETGKATLAADVLGLASTSFPEESIDQRIVDDLLGECLTDFKTRLEPRLDLTEAMRREEMLIDFRLGLRHETGLHMGYLALPEEALIRARRQRAPKGRGRTEPLAPLDPLIRGMNIDLVALAGQAMLPVAELRRLEVGDVLVLDHLLQHPIALALDRQTAPILSGTMVPSDTSRKLRLDAIEI